MPVTRTATARKYLDKEIEKLAEHEREIVQRFIERGRTARNVAQEFEEHLTVGQRIADRVAETMGSWTFIIIQSTLLLAWIVLNVAAYMNHWDPYHQRAFFEALRPLAGNAAYLLFTIGLVGTGMLGIPALAGSAAYAEVPEYGNLGLWPTTPSVLRSDHPLTWPVAV